MLLRSGWGGIWQHRRRAGENGDAFLESFNRKGAKNTQRAKRIPPLWIAVVGPKKSGKTSFIEALIPYLKEKGYRVATVKHSSHLHAFDREGSDTSRHVQAGATRVVLRSPRANFFLAYDMEEEDAGRRAEEFLKDFDVVIGEGFRDSAYPKIVLEGDEAGGKHSGDIILRSRLVKSGGERPVIPVEALDQVARYIAERLKR